MKRNITLLSLFAGLLVIVGCATTETETTGVAKKRFIDAWMQVNYPGLQPVGIGYYIDPEYEVEGTGESATKFPYLFVNYTKTDLEGNVTATTYKDVEWKLGNYDSSDGKAFYGPEAISMNTQSVAAGIEAAIKGMKVGGTRKAIVPSWLNTLQRFDKAEDYLEQSTGETDVIITIHLEDGVTDMYKWELDTLFRYVKTQYGLAPSDSLKMGFYKKVLREGKGSKVLPADTSVNVNYTGRRLDRQVFDTTIKDTAKVHRIYSAATEYKVVTFSTKEDYKESTLSGSKVIEGFSYGVSTMKPDEKAAFIFWSKLGYKEEGSKPAIPGYSPLEFVIELAERNK